MSLKKSVSSPPRKEVSPKLAAEMIGCSVGYIYALMGDGELVHRPILRRGKERGLRRITVESIERFLAKREEVSA
jgi:hypothetical protein